MPLVYFFVRKSPTFNLVIILGEACGLALASIRPTSSSKFREELANLVYHEQLQGRVNDSVQFKS